MNGYEKLINLLNKKTLSPEEKSYIKNLCAGDKEAEKIIDVYKKLKSSSRVEKKITTGQLADYVLYLNGIEPEDKNIILLIPEIEKQLRLSAELKKEFEMLNKEFSETDEFIAQVFSEDKTGETKQTAHARVPNKLYNFKRYSVYSLSAAAVVYVILLFAFNIFTPDYKKNIILNDDSDKSYSRGRVSEAFQQSLMYINNNDYEPAKKLLRKDITENTESKTVFYSHYVLGLLHLSSSKSNIVGLFTTYDNEELKQGIKQLELAVEKNTNPQFKNINLNAYFFIANAHLALGNIDKAKEYLNLVKNEKGGYMKNAESILESLGER